MKSLVDLGSDIYIIDDFFDDVDQIYSTAIAGKPFYKKEEGDCIDRYTFHLDRIDENHVEEETVQSRYLLEIQKAAEDAYGVKLVENRHIPFMVYQKGCHMGYHDDMYHGAFSDVEKVKMYTYSSVHFLNDEYEGGQLDFQDIDVTVPKRKNRLILFRSEYMHGSLEVTSGMKISTTHFWKLQKSNS